MSRGEEILEKLNTKLISGTEGGKGEDGTSQGRKKKGPGEGHWMFGREHVKGGKIR